MKIAVLALPFMLSGCALYDAYMMNNYDNNEYLLANDVQTIAEVSKEQCDNPIVLWGDIKDMYYAAVRLDNYSNGTEYNQDVSELTSPLLKMVDGMKQFYVEKDFNVSEGYCKAKMDQISRSAEKIQIAVGKKLR